MKYRPWFEIVDTEEQAIKLCKEENARGTCYKRKHHKATYTPWSSWNGKETGFIVWMVR